MKNPPPVMFFLGVIFGSIGFAGSLIMGVVFFLLPAEQRMMILAAFVFPVFAVLGLVFIGIGKFRIRGDSEIRFNGNVYPGRVLRILPYFGSRPVKRGRIYAAEVTITVSGAPAMTRVYFYGSDYKEIERRIIFGEPLDIIYYERSPKRSLIA